MAAGTSSHQPVKCTRSLWGRRGSGVPQTRSAEREKVSRIEQLDLAKKLPLVGAFGDSQDFGRAFAVYILERRSDQTIL